MNVSWAELLHSVETCERCDLRKGRSRTVPGEGNPNAQIMFIGEGPGADEDRTGRPFVGRAGELLTKMITAIGLEREQVYICNVVKCRPPGNRAPTPEEAGACLPYLRAQVALIRPKIIVVLGTTAGRYTLDPNFRVTRDPGKWVCRKGVWMMPTFHPSFLLRDEGYKPAAWQDFKAVRDKLADINSKL